jgi:hypothetical protein
MSSRVVVTGDTVAWLQLPHERSGWSVVSSIPDVSELGVSDAVWRAFFTDMSGALFKLVDDGGLLALIQTDVRTDGHWVDKSALVTTGVHAAGGELLARKIICRRPAGTCSTKRAAYSQLLVYGRGPLNPALPDTVPDVIADGGPVTWTRGVGLYAARAAIDVVRRFAPATTTIVDPFCGEGMILAVANDRGLRAIGVERHSKRAEQARRLRAQDIREGLDPRTISMRDETPTT